MTYPPAKRLEVHGTKKESNRIENNSDKWFKQLKSLCLNGNICSQKKGHEVLKCLFQLFKPCSYFVTFT